VSEKSRRVDHVIKAFDSGAVSGFLRGLLGGILASIIPIGGVALSIAVIFGISGGFQDLLSGFHAMSLVLIAMMSPVPLLISLGVVGAVSDNVKGISEMVMADEEVKKNAKELDISGTEDVSLVKSIIGVAGIMSCLIILVVMIKQILVTIGLKAQGQKVFLGDIHVSHTMLTDVGRINISDLTIQKLIHLLDLSILHPDVILGLLLGSIVIVVMCGLLMGAVQSGVASLTDAVREQMATKPGIWSGESLPDYHDIIEKASMKTITWVRRILLLAVVIPFISLVTIKLDGTLGLLVGMISTGVIVSLVSNYSGTMWQMAKKKMEITDENYAASSQYLSSIFVDGIGDVLKDTVAPSIYVIIKIMGILALVFGSVTLTLSL
jgi:K(+)-stimulated pyrophosphate-energized sodium pump